MLILLAGSAHGAACDETSLQAAAAAGDEAAIRACTAPNEEIDPAGVDCARQYDQCLRNATGPAATQGCAMAYRSCDPASLSYQCSGDGWDTCVVSP